MEISTLATLPANEWHDVIKQYVERSDRICGVILYYKLVEWWEQDDIFLPGTEAEWRILDILEALTGECAKECHIGTGDYHILE